MLAGPEAAPDRVGRWHRDDDLRRRVLLEEGDLGGRHRPSRPNLRDDRRVGQAGELGGRRLDDVVGKAVDGLGEDLYVALAPPLAVRHVIEAGSLLHTDGAGNGRIQQPVRLGLIDLPRLRSSITSLTDCGRGRLPTTNVSKGVSLRTALIVVPPPLSRVGKLSRTLRRAQGEREPRSW